MESTKSTQTIAINKETKEQDFEWLIKLLKKVNVTSSFVKNLDKNPGYLEFQQEVELRRQELLKSKQAGEDE